MVIFFIIILVLSYFLGRYLHYFIIIRLKTQHSRENIQNNKKYLRNFEEFGVWIYILIMLQLLCLTMTYELWGTSLFNFKYFFLLINILSYIGTLKNKWNIFLINLIICIFYLFSFIINNLSNAILQFFSNHGEEKKHTFGVSQSCPYTFYSGRGVKRALHPPTEIFQSTLQNFIKFEIFIGR